MNRFLKSITACALALVMTAISPMTDLSPSLYTGNGDANGTTTATGSPITYDALVGAANAGVSIARAAETGDQLYISDVKIGHAYEDADDGPDIEAVVSELRSGGYIILTDEDGNPADLNYEAGTSSAAKEGENEKAVILGYKTTTDPRLAITDLAVMNMNGGYSVKEYEVMMTKHYETHVKPFVERFISTINEYRRNYSYKKNEFNHKRAVRVHDLLNKLIDDDTGKPIGDLLLMETKYEMGDWHYDKLHPDHRKNHADIVTILMQGNGKLVVLMEMLLSLATDYSEDTWIERFMETSLDDLIEEATHEKSLTTKADVYAYLDKKYRDTAGDLLIKLTEASDSLSDGEEMINETVEEIEKGAEEASELGDRIDAINEKTSEDDIATAAYDAASGVIGNACNALDLRAGILTEWLDAVEYENGTLLDFFYNTEKFRGDGIRKLYPVVASLTDGQIAGFDFLSFFDLVSIATQSDKSLVDENLDQLPEASIYEDVDREIYEPGGVALTSDSARKQALSKEEDISPASAINTSTWIYWGVSAAMIVGSVASIKILSNMIKAHNMIDYESIVSYAHDTFMTAELEHFTTYGEMFQEIEDLDWMANRIYQKTGLAGEVPIKEVSEAQQASRENLKNLNDEYLDKMDMANNPGEMITVGKILTVTVVVITLALLAWTSYCTIKDMMEYYRVHYLPIPRYMVDEVDITAYNSRGEKIVINNQTAYYKVVTCNRTEGKTEIEKENYEKMGNRADLNGDIGRQWLALYSVRYKEGFPILADSLKYVKESDEVPSGYTTGIHEFGSKASVNLNKKVYLFASDPPEIHVFFKNTDASVSDLLSANSGKDDASDPDQTDTSDSDQGNGNTASVAAGSIFSDGSESGSASGITAGGVALGGGIGIVLGALLMALIMYFARRKKERDKA